MKKPKPSVATMEKRIRERIALLRWCKKTWEGWDDETYAAYSVRASWEIEFLQSLLEEK
jgi:hypothetical protein